jgi:16S rRNA C967 or C1407 C5-methylase (RsmB/RsmF family)/NOL1/NOP2/fmu family ribosome biogenesis protein
MDFRTSLNNYLDAKEADALVSAIENGKVTHALLLNPKKMSDEEFVKRYPHVKKHPFVDHAYLYDKDEYEFGQSMLYDDGVYSIEDASAMMVVHFLQPQKDDVILDICAAPGGKSIGASIAMEDQGTIIANDISYPRAKAMSQNVERMGRGNIIVASNDFVFSHIHFHNTFDKIIVDAPCSGSAMMRKNPEAKADWKYEKVKSNARKQLEILELAYDMLKEGGTLAYSTCSFSYEEDEQTIISFKEKHPEIVLLPLPEDPSFYRAKELPEAVHLFPNRFEGEGQFICLFQKPGTLIKSAKKVLGYDRYKDFLKEYGLSERSNEMMRSKFYSLSQYFDVTHLNILRYGVKLFEMRDIYIPDHHLSHFLTPEYSLPISLEHAKAYVHGDTFPLDKPDGFYIVSYDNQNLGFVKATQGVAKNHYPKGLRREWKD